MQSRQVKNKTYSILIPKTEESNGLDPKLLEEDVEDLILLMAPVLGLGINCSTSSLLLSFSSGYSLFLLLLPPLSRTSRGCCRTITSWTSLTCSLSSSERNFQRSAK